METRSMVTFVMLLCSCLVMMSKAQSGSNVRATFNLYNAPQINWDLNAVSAFCSTWDMQINLWNGVANMDGLPFVALLDLMAKTLVTNVQIGAQETVRIVDQCSNGGLDLDVGVFQSLDTDGNGNANGFLTVNYDFVNC
ncbi:hypothetical protein IC582_011766 [Cucumis melo]